MSGNNVINQSIRNQLGRGSVKDAAGSSAPAPGSVPSSLPGGGMPAPECAGETFGDQLRTTIWAMKDTR